MAEVNSSKSLNMDELFGFLENTAYDINMDPITRPFVVKSTRKRYCGLWKRVGCLCGEYIAREKQSFSERLFDKNKLTLKK